MTSQPGDFSALRVRKLTKDLRHERQEILNAIACCPNNNDGEIEAWKGELKTQVSIDGQECLEFIFCKRKKFTVSRARSWFDRLTTSVK